MGQAPATERFVLYHLSGLLEEGQRLVLDQQQEVLSLLQERTREGDWTIVEQQLFPGNEFYVLRELLAMHPYYCPLDQLLSAKTSRPLAWCQREVRRALDEGTADALLRPMRNVLSRVRPKLHTFGLDVCAILETGYTLMRDSRGKGKRRRDREEEEEED